MIDYLVVFTKQALCVAGRAGFQETRTGDRTWRGGGAERRGEDLRRGPEEREERANPELLSSEKEPHLRSSVLRKERAGSVSASG